MSHLRSLTYMVMAVIFGGLSSSYVVGDSVWGRAAGGLVALAAYGLILLADRAWTRRDKTAACTEHT
jgi:hypothetical protein